jgi:hypothetical protein
MQLVRQLRNRQTISGRRCTTGQLLRAKLFPTAPYIRSCQPDQCNVRTTSFAMTLMTIFFEVVDMIFHRDLVDVICVHKMSELSQSLF